VRHRQYSRTYGQRTVYRPERREIYGKKLRRSPSRPRFNRERPEKVDKGRRRSNILRKEIVRRSPSRPRFNREKPGKKLRRSPSRPRFNREKPEKVDILEKERKETSHQANPEENLALLSTEELNKILDQLAKDIEERIEIYKKDQLSRILSRNIGPERDDQGTPPA
jgi:hypothetical protein